MKDYKKMLQWVVCKEPRFDFELESASMVVWLHGENHVVEGSNTEDLIEKGMRLEDYLNNQEDLEDDQWEREQKQIRADESGLAALGSCYCDILSITCSYCRSR